MLHGNCTGYKNFTLMYRLLMSEEINSISCLKGITFPCEQTGDVSRDHPSVYVLTDNHIPYKDISFPCIISRSPEGVFTYP